MGQKQTIVILFLVFLAIAYQNCGSYTLLDTAPTFKKVEVHVASYCPSTGKNLAEIFVLNTSAIYENRELKNDTDRDGLSDDFESKVEIQEIYNIDPTRKQTAGLGYSDNILYSLGIKTQGQMALRECLDPDLDTDGDLLSDCEENLLGTNRLDPDTDRDGIPDGIEFRFGLNPVDPRDALSDLDGDGISNIDEIIDFLPISHYNDHYIADLKVMYDLEPKENGCYEVKISNIPLVPVNNGNEIKLIFMEKEIVNGQEEIYSIKHATLVVSRLYPTGLVIDVTNIENQTTIIAPEGNNL